MLYDDRNIRLDQARVVGAVRDRFGVLELVEADMSSPACGYRQVVGSDGLAIGEEDRDLDVRLFRGSVQDADCLVALELGFGPMAPAGDVALCDRPRSEEHTSELQSRGLLVC